MASNAAPETKATVLLDSVMDQHAPPTQPVIVSVYLQGGADSLHLVPPAGDADYRKARPTLAVAKDKALPLDEHFYFHPDLKELHGLFTSGQLALIHQCGTEEDSRSHFEAEDYLHYGGRNGGGWLGRFLHHTRSQGSASALTAVSIGEKVSDELQGVAAVAMRSLNDFRLPESKAPLTTALAKLYEKATPGLAAAGGDTLKAIAQIKRMAEAKTAKDKERKGSAPDPFTAGLELIAQLVRENLGLRAATISLGGWDSHFGQNSFLSGLLPRLSKGLQAFANAMGPDLPKVHLVVLSEFGRRISENVSLGTDHGRGGLAMVLGGGVAGGRIHHQWKGLDRAAREFPKDLPKQVDYSGDLPVVHDFRQILAPILTRVSPGAPMDKLFPGFTQSSLPLFG